jgi:hypothetical protein
MMVVGAKSTVACAYLCWESFLGPESRQPHQQQLIRAALSDVQAGCAKNKPQVAMTGVASAVRLLSAAAEPWSRCLCRGPAGRVQELQDPLGTWADTLLHNDKPWLFPRCSNTQNPTFINCMVVCDR